MIRLIATDMDGTLLDSEKRLPADFFPVLETLRAKGVRFAAASGRSYPILLDNFKPHGHMLDYICDNGAFVAVDGEVKRIHVIDRELVLEFIRFCRNRLPHLELLLCGTKGCYYEECEPNIKKFVSDFYINRHEVDSIEAVDDDIFKIAMCDLRGPENGSNRLLNAAFEDRLTMPISGHIWMDAAVKGVTKGAALGELQEIFGISPEETMVFGDFHNDIEMLQQGYYSYVMANAGEDIKAHGRFLAGSNDEDGVMRVIREKLESGEI